MMYESGKYAQVFKILMSEIFNELQIKLPKDKKV